MNKFKVTVTQIFDTYPEWTRQIGIVDTREEADQLITQALQRYRNRRLVTYCFNIIEIMEEE